MKNIQLRRHSIKQGPGDMDLSEEGIHLAQEIGKECLQGKNFTHIFVSPLKRTRDTAIAFMHGAGDFSQPLFQIFQPGVEVGGTEEALNLWSGVCNKAERAGQDMLQAALQKETEIAHKIATDSATSFKAWLVLLPDGANILVVGHSPFLELIAYGLFGTVLPQLQYCEGFTIIEDSRTLRLENLEKHGYKSR